MKQYNQAQVMRSFHDTHREQFNPQLFERNNVEMVESLHKLLLSCERDKYFTIKLLTFQPIWDYEEMYNTLRAHEEKRKRKNSNVENSYDFINIKDTDMILVKVEWLIRHNGTEMQEIDRKTVEVVNPQKVLEVLIALPRFTHKYYFRLLGNYYTTIFQIVDGSTYNNSTASQSKVDSITFKTMFMPVRIFRYSDPMVDCLTKKEIPCINYSSIIFNNIVNAMYYLLAQFGLYGLAEFLGINCISITPKPILDPALYCFENKGIYISCPKSCFEDPMVQAMCATIYNGIHKNTTINDLFDVRYWLKNLGMAFKNGSVQKGLFVLDSIDGIYDKITQEDLHLPASEKEDIYTVLRWLLREFSNLRVKENTDVRTKRIRITDYVVAVYAAKLSKAIYRISDMGSRVTLKKVEQAIYTQPMYIINNISTMSNLVAYRDMVNDNDATVALKYTYKGIAGLGENGASVQDVYRYVDPSNLGILDLDVSTNSDPGMSGMICPMAKLYGNSFSEYEEPLTWEGQYKHLQDDYINSNGGTNPIQFTQEPKKFDYMKQRERIAQEELDLQKLICPIYDPTDPTAYFGIPQVISEDVEEVPFKSLFTIRSDNE